MPLDTGSTPSHFDPAPEPVALVLQHAAPEGPGFIGQALAAHGVGTQTVRIDLGEGVSSDLGGARALVVLGGPMGVYERERYPHLTDELRLIRRALAEGVPVLGVCLGSQLLAHALGADVRPGPAPEIGWLPVTLEPAAQQDALFAGAPEVFTPLVWHGDVFTLPEGAVALARSEATAHQAFRYDGAGAPAYGLLFHLEATPQIARGMAADFADEVHEAGVDPAALAAEAASRLTLLAPVARTVFARWAALAAGEPAYVPVDCTFHDRLEDLAIRGLVVEAAWTAPDGQDRQGAVRVADVFARGGADYVKLAPPDGDAVEVRLDRLVSVDGVARPESAAC